MSKNHLTLEDFEGLLRDATRPNRARNVRIVRHLLAACSACCDQLQAMGWPASRLTRLVHLPGGSQDLETEASFARALHAYDEAFARADQAVSEFLAMPPLPREDAKDLLAELTRQPLESQEHRLQSEGRFASPQLVRELIERSHGTRYEDPEAMVHWANLAKTVALCCTVQSVGNPARLADLRARAWGQYGNSLRVAGRLREAEGALANAQAALKEGTGDPALRARLLEQTASLHTFNRAFNAAIEILAEAAEIYSDLGESHSLARTLVQEAIACLYAGEPEAAVHTLNRAIPLIDHEQDPQLLLAACHNLVRCYIDLDQPEQALSLYFETKDLYKEFSDALILLRASWQEGQLLRDVGHFRAAEAALLRARKGFLEHDLAYEVAVVSLDLAAVYVKLGASEQVKETVAETLPIFRALQVDREALGALLQLQQVADQENQALELIRLLTVRLEQLTHRPLSK